jgi:hypothetical protein
MTTPHDLQLPEPILSGRTREYEIDFLVSAATAPDTLTLREGERALMGMVLPTWQRGEVWTPLQRQRFIEGIFLGLGAGYYVTTEPEWDDRGVHKPGSNLLLDGQQRISAIRDFVTDNLAIFGNTYFSDLDTATQRKRFLRVHFRRVEVQHTEDEDLLKELYERLNFGGTPHTEEDRPARRRVAAPGR